MWLQGLALSGIGLITWSLGFELDSFSFVSVSLLGCCCFLLLLLFCCFVCVCSFVCLDFLFWYLSNF